MTESCESLSNATRENDPAPVPTWRQNTCAARIIRSHRAERRGEEVPDRQIPFPDVGDAAAIARQTGEEGKINLKVRRFHAINCLSYVFPRVRMRVGTGTPNFHQQIDQQAQRPPRRYGNDSPEPLAIQVWPYLVIAAWQFATDEAGLRAGGDVQGKFALL